MKFMITGRGAGKTTEMIKWMKETGASCVVHSAEEAHRLEKGNPELKGKFITFHHFLNGHLQGWKGTIGIDNIDLLLYEIARGVHVGLVTGTEEPDAKGQ